jgi:hypothetical protein
MRNSNLIITWDSTLNFVEIASFHVFPSTLFINHCIDLRGMRWRENGGSCTLRSFIFCTYPQISLADQVKAHEVDRLCCMRGRGDKSVRTRFWWESPKERDHSEDQGIDGRLGSECILGRLVGGYVDWIWLAQDRDRWRAVVNAVMNLQVFAPGS